MIASNFRSIYKKIMEQDSSIWSVITYFKKLKDTMGGFDHIVLYDKADMPSTIIYMPAGMRYNLLRYGDIIFLDSQAIQ